MNPYLLRLNSVLTLAATGLGILAVLVALTDFTRLPVVAASASVASYDGLAPFQGDDRAWLTVDLDADLRPLWHWNTKQVFLYVTAEYLTKRNHLNQVVLWSRIVERRGKANIHGPVRVADPYAFVDQGTGLRGQPFNLTVAWETVPHVGLQHRTTRSFPGFRFPEEYFRSARMGTSRWR